MPRPRADTNFLRGCHAIVAIAAVRVLCFFTHMAIPVSALQRNAAAVVRRVAASGVAEEITDRGRVVAVIGPPTTARGYHRLVEAGAVRPAEGGGVLELFDELDQLPGLALGEALEEQRDTSR
jgi:antitoxin (DNA-binding transcriptional repressor) of toxin-antitoxin stability system